MAQSELAPRWQKVRTHLATSAPDAVGLLVFSRLNIYYLSGTMANGVLWLPAVANSTVIDPDSAPPPVLLVRKGIERARMESPLTDILEFRSYKDIPTLLAQTGAALPMANVRSSALVAAEMGGLSWAMASMLQERLPLRFVSGDSALDAARAIKSPWEMAKLRTAGARHYQALHDILPQHIRPGMSENDIARLCINSFLELGHGGQLRMSGHGEEVFVGHVAAADSGNYPHYFNGPMGFRGIHPAQPCLGGGTLWTPGSPLLVDMAFCFEGYATDKTQIFWAGRPDSMPDNARRAYELCVEIHNRAASALRPGVLPSDIWRDALNLVEKSSFSEGFMGLGGNKVPFLGHGIGLAIDEKPVIAHSFDQALKEGMVLALEPKIGLPGWGMVGLENTFAVSPYGGESLTGNDTDILFF